MKRVIGPMVELDAALDIRIVHHRQRDADHGFEVGEHTPEQVPGPAVGPARNDRMSKEIQSLSSFAIRSMLLCSSSSARSLRQLTPGSLLNQVRCRRA